MDNKRPLIAHLCLFCSGAFWGLMAPVGKDAMLHGIDGKYLLVQRGKKNYYLVSVGE